MKTSAAILGLAIVGLPFAARLGAQQASGPQPPLKPGLYAVFDTSEGEITAELYEKYTPIAVKTFVGLATGTHPWVSPTLKKWVKGPMYDNITFHRVVRDEMIQSGDPTGKGNHNCGFTIHDEILPGFRFDRAGKLAMANAGSPDSGGCQFFITADAVPQWTGTYTIFGQVVEGQDVVRRINHAPVKDEKPLDPVALRHVRIVRVAKPEKPH
jgi:cyclophilin family peptidyl-prolyl cis-trans isomerase